MNKIEEAKKVLRDYGYYVDNLWNISDVWNASNLATDMTDDEKYKILDEVLTSDRIIYEVNESIDFELNR